MKTKDLQIVIIGNGVAGNSAASAIRKNSKEATITMISQEPFPEYSPYALSKRYISGEMRKEEVFLKNLEDYSKDNVKILLGQKVTGLETQKKKVILETRNVGYDKMIIATGGKPLVPPIPGVDKEGIFALKSLGDAERIYNFNGKKAVVIGAGPIGVEASISLKKRGLKVSLVEQLGQVLPTIFDEGVSLIIRKIIEDYGIEVITGQKAIRFNGDGHIRSVVTEGREIGCDMVVLALGIRPSMELAQKAGIEIGSLGGIKVNGQMMTNAEDVYACGDCVESRDAITGKDILCLLWHNAKQQGEIAGYNSIGIRKNYSGAMNISVVDILGTYAVSIGHTMESFKGVGLRIIEDKRDGYHRLLIADGIIVGAQIIGRTADIGPLISVILRRDNLENIQKVLREGNFLSKYLWCYRLYPYIK